MKLRLSAAAACAAVSVSLFVAPAAQAAGISDLLNIGAGAIAGANCSDVRNALTLIDNTTEGQLLTPDTTRNQLAQNLAKLNGNPSITDPLALVGVKFSGAAADRALQCNIVKKDPDLLPGSSLPPQLNDLLPLVNGLSSQLPK